jgi:hypothetical protein
LRKRRAHKREAFESVDHFDVVEGISVGGANQKDVLEDPESGQRFIAKLGRRNNDVEVMTEYAIYLVGRSLGVTVADALVQSDSDHADPQLPPPSAASTTSSHQRPPRLICRYTGEVVSLLETLKRLRPARKPPRFVLRYVPPAGEHVTVGQLEFLGGTWTFRYDDEYKKRRDLRPIEGFGDLEKVYSSSVLFPFFAVRIPDADRDDVRRKLDEEHVRDPEPTDMLRIFGRSVVSSPAFELLPA